MFKQTITLIWIFLTYIISYPLLAAETHIVTNVIGGYTGNQILSLAKAMWVAKQNNWPFYLSTTHPILTRARPLFKMNFDFPRLRPGSYPMIPVKSLNDLIQNTPVCFRIASSFPLDVSEFSSDFRKQFRSRIFSETSYESRIPETNERYTVALHIRTGLKTDCPKTGQPFFDIHNLPKVRGLDAAHVSHAILCHLANSSLFNKCQAKSKDLFYLDSYYTLLALPLQYYLDQLQLLYNHLQQRPLYVHIFTDHKKPANLVNALKSRLTELDIEWGWHPTNTAKNSNIMRDIENIGEFDAFIRSNSTFAQTAQLLGDHKIVIFPKHAWWFNNILAVDVVGIVENDNVSYYRYFNAVEM